MTSTLASLSRLATPGPESRSGKAEGEAVQFSFTVSKDKFHMRLKTSKEKYPVVSGFDKDADGLPGEVEASGRVVPGDYLKSVNGISLYDRPFKQCVTIIRRECNFSGNKELIFFRFEKASAGEDSSWQTKSPMYSTYSTQVLSAIRDRRDLDMNIAREFSKLGLPDDGGVRSVMWRVLLGFLPPEASTWESSLARSRASYQDLLSELIVNPWAREDPQPLPPAAPRRRRPPRSPSFSSSSTCFDSLPPPPPDHTVDHTDGRSSGHHGTPSTPLFSSPPSPSSGKKTYSSTLLASLLGGAAATEQEQEGCSQLPLRMDRVPASRVSDDPLNLSPTSAWKGYWEDWLLHESIEKDVIRTYPCLHFFAEQSGGGQSKPHAALQRILYLYAKLNPGIKYVQGMNELVGTLYYVFGNHMSYEPWREHVEADTFFCFSLLMIDTRDLFIRNLDDASCGIGGRIQDFVDTLQYHDPEVASLLEHQGIAPSFYSLRWITTLFTREFDLFDTIRLWDSLFADTDRHDLLCCLCCTMVMEQRDELLAGDFTANLTLLQHYPPIDISYFLSRVDQLRAQDKAMAHQRACKKGVQTRNDEWNSGSSEQGTGGSSIAEEAGIQPLMGQLLTSMHSINRNINENHWLSGVRHSLFSGHGVSSHCHRRDETLVPCFRLCRNSDLLPPHLRCKHPSSSASSGGGVAIPTFEHLLARSGLVGGAQDDTRRRPPLSATRKIDGNVIVFDDVDTGNDSYDDGKKYQYENSEGYDTDCAFSESENENDGGGKRWLCSREERRVAEEELFEPMWVFGSPLE